MYVKRILMCLVVIFLITFKSNSQQQDINNAILAIIQNQNVNSFIRDSIIDGRRETIRVTEIDALGVDDSYTEVLTDNDIEFLYFPFIDLNINERDTIQIVNLDNVDAENDLIDLVTNDSLSLAQIMNNFTVMYKTVNHDFDSEAEVTVPRLNAENNTVNVAISLEGKWLPWRRCYCSQNNSWLDPVEEQWVTGSMGSCSMYHQEIDRCGAVCDRTGFFNQTCDGDNCISC